MDLFQFSEYCSSSFLEQTPQIQVISWGRIPLESLTRLRSSAIILRYEGGQDQADTPKFKQAIFVLKRDELSNLTVQYQYFSQLIFNFLSMFEFNVQGDMGRHFLSISGASAECGISTSTINRESGKSFPPKRLLFFFKKSI